MYVTRFIFLSLENDAPKLSVDFFVAFTVT